MTANTIERPHGDNDNNKETLATAAKQELIRNAPFPIKHLHQKALLRLLHAHQTGSSMTYSDLSLAIGVGEKTKSWQCEAWKHLNKNDYIVLVVDNCKTGKKKTYGLSPKGIELAQCFCSPEELAEYRTPLSNEELHNKIRKQLARDCKNGKHKHSGRKLFDVLLQAHQIQQPKDVGLTRLELAYLVGTTNPDSHGFFYGFKALQKLNLIQVNGQITRAELKRKSEKLQETSKENNKLDPSTADDDKGGAVTEPKTKKKKTCGRLPGGCQLFALSDRAFLSLPVEPQTDVKEKYSSVLVL